MRITTESLLPVTAKRTTQYRTRKFDPKQYLPETKRLIALLRETPFDIELSLLLVQQLRMQRLHCEAVEVMSATLTQQLFDWRLYMNRGYDYLCLGRLEEGLTSLEIASRLHIKSFDCWYYLVIACCLSAQYERAEFALTRAKELWAEEEQLCALVYWKCVVHMKQQKPIESTLALLSVGVDGGCISGVWTQLLALKDQNAKWPQAQSNWGYGFEEDAATQQYLLAQNKIFLGERQVGEQLLKELSVVQWPRSLVGLAAQLDAQQLSI